MSRSNWKGPIFQLRSSLITPSIIGKYIKVSTGNNFKYIKITTASLGLKFGQLIATKKPAVFKV